MEKRKQVLVIAGPTGSGESTVTRALIERFSVAERLITATTRPPRSGEEEGKDYYFFSESDFKDKVAKGEILESTHIAERNVYYGTYAPDLEERLGRNAVIIVNPDIIGAKYYKNNYNATTIFLVPGSVDELVSRIRSRNPEMSEEEIRSRRICAELELQDEQSFYDHVVLNKNGGLDAAIEEVIGILQKEGYNLK